MNLIEAAKSGKRFRRGRNEYFRSFGPAGTALTREDILAEDWEEEEKKVEITYMQLLAAFMTSAAAKDALYNIGKVNDMAKKLGLID